MTAQAPQNTLSTGLLSRLAAATLYVAKEVEFIPQASHTDYPYLLYVKNSDAYLRCAEWARELIVRCDGETPLASILTKLPDTEVEHHRRDVEDTLSLLISMGVLAIADEEDSSLSWLQKLKQPMAVKVPLHNPDRWLALLGPLSRVIFSLPFMCFLGLLLLYSVSVFAIEWSAITLHWESRFFDPSNALLMILIYPLMKFCHELGHGLAVKRFGGHVYECGIVFLVFIPLPYVDASSSYRFPRRRQRVIVGLAGMLIEFFLALCALNLWAYSSSGTLMSDLLFDVFFIGTFSTLVFNINPLMKFDGYYILADALGIDNLSTKAKNYVGGLLARWVLGLSGRVENYSRKEQYCFFIYGILSIPYRLFISLWITLYLSTVFFALGSLLALYVLFQQLLFPIIRGLSRVYKDVTLQQQQSRFYTVLGIVVCCVFVVGFIFRFPVTLPASGIVLHDNNERVIAKASGVAQRPLVQVGDWVEKGQAILQLTNPVLREQQTNLEAQLSGLEARYDQFLSQDPLAAADMWEQIASMKKRLVEVSAQVDALTVTSPASGFLEKARWQDISGRYLERGEALAAVFNANNVQITTVIDQADINKIRHGLKSVHILFDALPSRSLTGKIERIVPAAADQLPSKYLGSLMGGGIAVDDRDASGTRLLSKHFIVDVQVEAASVSDLDFKPINARVKFEFENVSLANRLLDWLYVNLLRTYGWAL
ncbi:efflux RND transporter periplasmic adaptor subunit [Neptunomonas phycophila]|uniref:Efflux RND transporter periplasmic adaptor subunit n=1 Tax=Neptunomonas phycophila TaxID=1572645 RepID=A0AAW7XG51_9GAMM|nr:efflux RND transporter periplasmic adaptor subunit [Neptunomonas phycophila]MDO6452049.1 efflux RND transporter periplasmic adaptor subunit [Neptunomonas phycophila]